MKVAIIGAGKIGGTLARLFVQAGHSIALSNSQGPESLRELVEPLKPLGIALASDQAVVFGDLVIVATPFGAYRSLPHFHNQKILVDASNYYAQRDGDIEELDSSQLTSSELLAKQLGASRVVKAFNTIEARQLGSKGDLSAPLDDRQAIFVAGDEFEAKGTVALLIEQIGFAPIDTGSLADGGRRQQPGSDIYGHLMSGKEAEMLLNKVHANNHGKSKEK